MVSVVSRYIGTTEKHAADTTTFRCKPNGANQSSIEPLKLGRDGEAIIVGYWAICANDGVVSEMLEWVKFVKLWVQQQNVCRCKQSLQTTM